MRDGLLKALTRRLKVIEGRCYKEMQPHDLTLEWAIRQWEERGGRCHYTGIPMRLGSTLGRHPLSLSLDRVDSTQGYVQCNVVLCCVSVNLFKSNMTSEQFAYILQRIALNVSRQPLLQNPFWGEEKTPSNPAPARKEKARFDQKKWVKAHKRRAADEPPYPLPPGPGTGTMGT